MQSIRFSVVSMFLAGLALFTSTLSAQELDKYGGTTLATLTVEQIESEDAVASPHGIWGALGTIAGEETTDRNDYY